MCVYVCMYVCTAAGKETLEVIKQALKTQFAGSQPRPCDTYWFDGQPCIAKYYLDEGWYRAKVLQVQPAGRETRGRGPL